VGKIFKKQTRLFLGAFQLQWCAILCISLLHKFRFPRKRLCLHERICKAPASRFCLSGAFKSLFFWLWHRWEVRKNVNTSLKCASYFALCLFDSHLWHLLIQFSGKPGLGKILCIYADQGEFIEIVEYLPNLCAINLFRFGP